MTTPITLRGDAAQAERQRENISPVGVWLRGAGLGAPPQVMPRVPRRVP